MTRLVLAALALALVSCGPALSDEPDITVTGWARETAPGQSVAAAYLTIENRGPGADRLVGVSSPAADAASFHSTITQDGIARMRAADGFDIPARGSALLEPGGDHVMLEGLRQPLSRGDTLELQLQFERSGQRQVDIRILEPGAHPETHAGH